MDKEKEKKKTLTISSNFKNKIDSSSLSKKENRKSFSIPGDKKNVFKTSKNFRKMGAQDQIFKNQGNKNKKFTRKFVEQQTTKDFIKKDEKPTGKSKLKLKTPIDKRDFKLTVSRALNVEEIEIKQRSLAAVKRARLKEKKNTPDAEEKKEYKKVIKEVKIPEQITIQVALLTDKIENLSSHLKKFNKDRHSSVGLLKAVNKRKKLLDYLKKNKIESYKDVISKLKLRK
jgi:small subunit ribosomal protein S15